MLIELVNNLFGILLVDISLVRFIKLDRTKVIRIPIILVFEIFSGNRWHTWLLVQLDFTTAYKTIECFTCALFNLNIRVFFVLTISSLIFCSHISMINFENPQLYYAVTICLFWDICLRVTRVYVPAKLKAWPDSTSINFGCGNNKLVRISVENIEGNGIMISWNGTKIQRSRTGYQIHYKNSDEIQIITVRATLTVP